MNITAKDVGRQTPDFEGVEFGQLINTPTKTLRDEIAIEVLKCLMTASQVSKDGGTIVNAAEFPEIAYAFADKMMEVREGK